MSLFDQIDRNDQRSAYHAEPEFIYLNYSGRPELQRVRDLIDGWFEQYPDGDKHQLRSSFRSKNDLEHLSAYFELFLHQSLLRKGYQITVHPELSHTSRRPDFLIEHPDGFSGYMEAVIASEDSNERAAERDRANRIYDVLNDVQSPDFWISVEVEGVLGRDFPKRQVVRPTQQWIDGLSYDDAIRRGADTDNPVFSSTEMSLGTALVRLEAIPKGKKRGDPTARPVGIMIGGTEIIDPVDTIRGALKRKSGRYGRLDRPYIIAVNALSEGFGSDIAEDALFGMIDVAVSHGNGRLPRMADGSWKGPKGPQNTRVSGALMVDNLRPSRLARVTWTQYHNPCGRYPLGDHIQGVPSRRMVDEGLVSNEGMTPREIFGLTENWPE